MMVPDPATSSAISDDELTTALAQVSADPVPAHSACLNLARVFAARGDHGRATQWAFAASDASDDFAGWLSAARIVRRSRSAVSGAERQVKVAILGSYTTSQLASLLPLAAARARMDIELYECGYDQYRREVLDPTSALYVFDPDVVVLAVHDGAVALSASNPDPSAAVEDELERWTSLWHLIDDRLGATIVQHTFAIPPDVAMGHLAARSPGSRYALLHRLNQRMGEEAGDRVALVDTDRLAGAIGKYVWFDARYFHLAKQAVGLNAVPLLARHTAAVIAAQQGLAKKCLVLDLDNTLWGGVLGEVGIHSIEIGSGAVGEAFSAFQRYVLELKAKGVILAICSKNNDADVRDVFENHPDMTIRLDDIALLSASWEDKPRAIRHIGAALGIGMDSMVFVDDNPAEREAVRELVPEVDVIPLPGEPAGYVRAVSAYPFFETATLTADDFGRTEQYRARAELAATRDSAGTMEDFLAGLDMHAEFGELNEANVARVAQLIGKTNQFNVTTRRRSLAEVERLRTDPGYITQVVRLRDRFADHGIIGVLLAEQRGTCLDLDTWLLSCRVIGRTVEELMMNKLRTSAQELGCTTIRGTFVPSAKNVQVANLFPRLGFSPGPGDGTGTSDSTVWLLELSGSAAAPSYVTDAQTGPDRKVRQ